MILRGTFEKLWSTAENGEGYFTIRLTEPSTYDSIEIRTINCVGHIKEYNKGFPLTVEGEIKKTDNGKLKFKVTSYEEDLSNGNALKDYLSTYCKGIGPTSAQKLFKEIGGKDPLEALSDEKKRKAISKKTKIEESLVDRIYKILTSSKQKYQLFHYLYVYGLSNRVPFLYKMYGSDAIALLQKHPYKVLSSVEVGFEIMDEIGFYEGLPYDSEERMEALALSSFKRISSNGSTYVELSDIFSDALSLARQGFYTEQIPKHFISFALTNKKIFHIDYDNKTVALQPIYQCELEVFHHVKRLEQNKHLLDFPDTFVEDTEKDLGFEFDDDQKNAFELLKTTGLKILTGGAGVGKTSLVNGLIHAYKERYPYGEICLLAPTGMAAKNLSEKTGLPAHTIHRGIKFQPCKNEYGSIHGKVTPLTADFVIVDEYSMVDTVLTSLLMSCIKDDALVLFLGDKNQIDSIGYGMVFKDMIASGVVPTYTLSVLHRQDAESLINRNAILINQGSKNLTTGSDFQIVTYNEIAELYSYLMDNKPDCILSTTKKGPAGTKEINKWVQTHTVYKDSRELHRYGYVFHVGDKVVCTKNDYVIGVVNGDIGYITDITLDEKLVIDVYGYLITLPHSYLGFVEPAYCITIHKSQGSEYDSVCIVLPEYYTTLLEKNLFYTAVTRGRKNVTILMKESSKSTMEIAIDNDKQKGRNTSLYQLLKKADYKE